MSETDPASPAVAWSIRVFREARGRYQEKPCEDEMRSQAILGVGVLIGGGFPHAAASVSIMAEARFPQDSDWPWSTEKDQPR